MRRVRPGSRCHTTRPQRRALRAAVILGTVGALVAGTAPLAFAPAAAASTVSSPAVVSDPGGETAAVEMLKATYFNDVDTKNWLSLRGLFTPDAVVDTTGSLGPYFPNRDTFIVFTALTLSAINTRHQGYDPQINLTSNTTASAVWTMQDRLSIAGLITIHGYGHYTDNYEEVDGQWRITYSKLTRTGFSLEFPAFQNFADGLADAYASGGPVKALLYVGPALVDIPVGALQSLVGAIASNFGGPPAKAQPITVPPGSTGVTTEPPGITSVPSTTAASSSARMLTRTAPVTTKRPSLSAAKPFASRTADSSESDQSPELGAAQPSSGDNDKPATRTQGGPHTATTAAGRSNSAAVTAHGAAKPRTSSGSRHAPSAG